ncbi:MAG: hypothetical protein Q8P18_27130 [Pseudomonadota bacterium]|nr:hypothetical protein [Pseudomonadota bacterium]
MNEFPWEVLVLGLVLGINRLGTPATYHRPLAFWGIQVMNLAVAIPVALRGIQGAEGFPALGWLIAGLLVFHVLQNVSLRSMALTKKRQELAEREQLRKLRALEPTPDDAPREAAPSEFPSDPQ